MSEGANKVFGCTLRVPGWRYTEWDEARQGRELYNHEHDPLEQTNLASDPGQAERIRGLSAQLAAAVKAGYPKSGKTPPVREGVWAPNLTDP